MAAKGRNIVFLFNLLQDVNILRGLVLMAARETEAQLSLLVSKAFSKRDRLKIWVPELADLARATGAEMVHFATPAEVAAHLQDRGGLMIAASESNLDAHAETRDAFRIAPGSFLRVTLQHGLECIGFRQSREHVMSHGRNITFNADLVCAWLPEEKLTALTYSERGKLQVTGPPTLMQPTEPPPDHPPLGGGLICENMHSVRLNASGNHRGAFMEIFFDFCDVLGARGDRVTLRPHPGGQYVLKNKVALPENVRLNTLPTYRVDLGGYAYGISAPSTIVLDMVLAGLPTAVWVDADGVMDASNYDGLTMISTLEDWLAFERDAAERPEMILARQRDFLDRLGMPTDPEEVRARFLKILRAGLGPDLGRPTPVVPERPAPGDLARPQAMARPAEAARVLALTDPGSDLAEAHVLAPLRTAAGQGEVVLGHLTETAFAGPEGVQRAWGRAEDWLADRIAGFAPDLIVVCDWQSGQAARLGALAHAAGAPVLLAVDPGFLRRARRATPGRSEAALIAAATFAHLHRGKGGRDLARVGLKADVLEGPFSAALARSLGRCKGLAHA